MGRNDHSQHTAHHENGNQQESSAAENIKVVHNPGSRRNEEHRKIGQNKGGAILNQLERHDFAEQQYKQKQKPDNTARNREMQQLCR